MKSSNNSCPFKNKKKSVNQNKQNNIDTSSFNINSENYTTQTEFKVIPKDNDNLCLLDPVLLSWIVSIICLFIYIVGIKYQTKL
jgi:hypothetical protein